ncbi:MAG: beta/alpha barrel domain-containing protein [Leptospirales bacterium]
MLAPPIYDIRKSYDENYQFGPFFSGIPPKPIPPSNQTVFLGKTVSSRIGIPAGPLLNSRWIGFYAKMGFDILTYKTVRSHYHASYPNPNCLYVPYHKSFDLEDLVHPLIGTLSYTPSSLNDITITNSFGMPSQSPDVWMQDVQKTHELLAPGQVMVVSLVGTQKEDTDLAGDFVRTAKMAREAGSDLLEVNFSCPNVKGKEGQLYQNPDASGAILKRLRKELGPNVSLIMKIGFIEDQRQISALVEQTSPFLDAISAINTVSGQIINPEGHPALPGPGRERAGLCGGGIKPLSLRTIRCIRDAIRKRGKPITLIGVGGFNTVEDYPEFRDAGADFVMSATGAMWDPFLAYHVKQRSFPQDITRNV